MNLKVYNSLSFLRFNIQQPLSTRISFKRVFENKLKRINVCSQLAKINKLFDDGKLTKGDFFNHDLEYIMQLRQECP